MVANASSGDGSPVLTPIGRTVGESAKPDADRVSSRDATPAQGVPVPPPPPRDATPAEGVPRVETPPSAVAEPVGKKRPAKVRRTPRRARLYVYKVDTWSVMKVAFMLSVAVAIILVTAVAGTWWILDYSGVFATIGRNVNEVIGSGTTTFDLQAVLAFDRVMGIAVVIAALEIALVSILSGIFAVLYNLTVGITGGVEVTFSDAV